MIHVVVSVGTGDRKAPVIQGDLIIDENSARIRALQELAKATYVVASRTLEMPHDPALSHGTITTDFSFQPLSIFGRHLVLSQTISLTPSGASDSVALEQYRPMEV